MSWLVGQLGSPSPAWLALALMALALSGCQSLAPTKPAPELAREHLEQSLAILGSTQASDAERTRAQTQYRRTLERVLPAVAEGEVAPELIIAPADPPNWRDPQDLAEIDPVRRPAKADSGLQRPGLGAPAVGSIIPGGANAPRRGYRVPLTALALPAPKADQLRVALADPLRVESIDLGPVAGPRDQRQPLPVAMDLEAPLDATRALGPGPLAGLHYLLRADRFAGESRLTFLQPFDPEKRPLVLVHGLMTTPQMWNRLVRELMADPSVREHYQFWFFYYPTAQPVPLSAMQLRAELDQAVAVHGPTKPIVLVGYSMGGVLSRAQITGLDAVAAEQILPGVSQLPASSPVRQALIFEPRDDISRAIFMFTPHRGSRLATFNLALWVSRLIRLPNWVRNELELVTDRLAGLDADRIPTSIQGLSPDSPFLALLDQAEISVPTHSVIGNRGRRGEISRSSDGVVPYWSAHLPSAESEVIVPTGHGGFAHPLAVQELIRILHEDLALVSSE
ncbi:esterase/lipase family protein [Halochromatium roseum]|uniref:esterase/lipase family protein n=1 Tax=Halochromatium roseum TaxID=391920 RepID=UPI001913B7BA|nr:alpha/beta fold hydrolase [Halochromatium roseum]